MQTSYTVSKVTTSTTSKPATQVVTKRSAQPATVSTNKSGTQVVSSQRQVITTSSTSSSRPTNQVVTQKTTTTVTTSKSSNQPLKAGPQTSQVANKRSQNTTTTTTTKTSVSPQKQTTTKTTVQVNTSNRNKTVPVKVQPATQTSTQVKVNVQTSHRAASKPVNAPPSKPVTVSKPAPAQSTSKPSSQAPTKKVEIKQERHYTYNPELDGDKIREAFELFDSNDGRLNAQEVRDAMQNIGYDETNPAIFQVVTELDTNRNKKEGGATFNDFCQTVNYRIPEKETDDDLRKIFELFIDDPQSETTSLESIKRVADELGENIREDELNAMLNKASKAGARLTFDDFVAIMKESF